MGSRAYNVETEYWGVGKLSETNESGRGGSVHDKGKGLSGKRSGRIEREVIGSCEVTV